MCPVREYVQAAARGAERQAAAEMVNEQVARYLQAHPGKTYEQIARTLGVSRWRFLTVTAGLGISRKTGGSIRIRSGLGSVMSRVC
jgi:hypothetical protein